MLRLLGASFVWRYHTHDAPTTRQLGKSELPFSNLDKIMSRGTWMCLVQGHGDGRQIKWTASEDPPHVSIKGYNDLQAAVSSDRGPRLIGCYIYHGSTFMQLRLWVCFCFFQLPVNCEPVTALENCQYWHFNLRIFNLSVYTEVYSKT